MVNGSPTEHTLGRGLLVLWDNLKSFDLWHLGWRGSLLGALILVMAGWRNGITPLLLGGIIVLPLGYVFLPQRIWLDMSHVLSEGRAAI